jgi:hypothetical protein
VVVVGHVDGGDVELPQQNLEVHAVLLAQRLVEVREGLVHQEQRGVPRDAAAQRHPLLLPAGQGRRHAVEQMCQLHAHQLAGALVLGALHRVHLGRLLPEEEVGQHVGPRRHVRVERVVLEHHADAPVARAHVIHVDVVIAHVARVRPDQARDDLEQGGLAAPARPQDDHGLAVRHAEREVLDGEGGRAPRAGAGIAERLADVH